MEALRNSILGGRKSDESSKSVLKVSCKTSPSALDLRFDAIHM